MKLTPTLRVAGLTVLAGLALAPGPAALARAAQDPPAGRGDKPVEKPIERLEQWPKPSDKDRVQADIERVCKAHTPEMGAAGHAALVQEGAGCVPQVLERYGRERDEDAQARLFAVLMETTDARHTRVLGQEFGHKQTRVRSFALWRAAAFPDPALREGAEAALRKVVKQGERGDAEERYAAALCCAATGSTAGLEALHDATATPKIWDKRKRELRAALEGCRGKEASELVLARLEGADRKAKVAVLRMLAGCGERSFALRVRPFLDEEDNSIRIAAINALRGMVDGAGPLEDLSAFEAIETAKQWKGRL